MSIIIAIPVWRRPASAQPLITSIRASQGSREVEPVFLCSPGDEEQILACEETGERTVIVPWENCPGDYCKKINLAVTLGEHEWIFTAADDLKFHSGWAEQAMRIAGRFPFRVIGTNDLGNPAVKRGRHSTHTFVHRSYQLDLGTIDQPGLIYHEGYHHNWCDAEMIETAKSRREFVFAQRAYVEHLHPTWRKSAMDATYEQGLADFKEDHRLYRRRRRLWAKGKNIRPVLL